MNTTAPAGAADSPPFSTPLAVALAAGAAVPAVLRMRTSLWLDETITYWAVADGGFLDAIEKTLRNPPQSVLYTPFVWAAVQLGGPSEAVLRIPSFIATALACGRRSAWRPSARRSRRR